MKKGFWTIGLFLRQHLKVPTADFKVFGTVEF